MRRLLFALALLPTPALAQSCEDRGQDYEARLTLCDQAFAQAENNSAAAMALAFKAEALRLLGRHDEAEAVLKEALGYTPDNAWVWVELGNVAYDTGEAAEALAHYSAALAVEDNVDAWANRAEVWWQYRMGERCNTDADNALRIDPNFAYGNEIKGRCLIDLGRAEEALAYFDTAIGLYPGYQNAYRNKLAALAALGRHEEVVTVAEMALNPDVVPDPIPAIEEDILSRRLLALSHYAPAETVATEADALLARYPGSLAAANVKARALLTAGDLAGADQVTQPLRQETQGRRMEAIFHDTLAQIDVGLGRFEDAYLNYAAAMDLDPTLSRAYARSLSGLGFLPLSNSPPGVLTALRRCLDVKKVACKVTG